MPPRRCGWAWSTRSWPRGEGMARARALAATMAQRAPVALQTAKLLVNAAEGEEASAAIEVLAGALAAGTADAREGVPAFREKRKPGVRGQVRS